MRKAKVLYISHEMLPFLEVTELSKITRALPQGAQERGREIRTFMPRFGVINERRNQLHEVIRLSGMNLIIDDNDHPLIIKVASIQSARMQVYFIDNEEYFQRKMVFHDAKEKFFKDNEDRMVFFCRGVLETVKKLGWAPDIIHCSGWMTALVPYFIKTSYKEEPLFKSSRVVYSAWLQDMEEEFSDKLVKKVKMDGLTVDDLKHLRDSTMTNAHLTAMKFSDAVVKANDVKNTTLDNYLKKANKPIMPYQPFNDETKDDYLDATNDFYNELLEAEPAYAD
jgi:starch synthase